MAKDERPLMKRLLDAGYPIEQMDHHESDLYVYVTPLTTKVLDEWLADNGFERLKDNRMFVDKFNDQITGKQMYDIAFQYSRVYELWDAFGDVPMDPETECIETEFEHFPTGTHREEIWHWFEDTFGVRIADLLYGGGVN